MHNVPDDPMPSEKRGGLKTPLLLNAGLIVLLALLSYGFASINSPGHHDKGEAALVLFFLLLGLFLLNGVAVFVTMIMGRTDLVRGFLLGGLLVFLVGLGTCGYSLEHLHIDTR